MTSLDDFPEGILIGEPIIGLLEPKDMFEDGQRGVSESTFYATEVQLEVQFLDEVNSFFEDFLMENIFVDDWVGDTLWVKEKCFEGAYSDCYAERKYTFIRNPNPKNKNLFEYGGTQHRLQK